ncbi:acetyl-CoA synthetase-like protein [Zopfia rhizophila CBS 207.26]|uniref:Acetyl-CoA synthetase-like protein n=1 Tax=Zopfia rhizophila CBS 207.26 TaxID=1314779 RepID=A0A6A6EQP4_9PEZI|nr:acetyl-CoA synthetase-like protein [Zopfia rhizophila CBS 207.26]
MAEICGEPFHSLPDISSLFREAVDRNPHVEAVVSLHQKSLNLPRLDDEDQHGSLRWTYSQLYRGAELLASRLERLGVRKGSAIAFFCENRAEWVLLCWTSVLLGCPFVPLNSRLAGNETEVNYILDQVSPSVIVVVDERVALLLERKAVLKLRKAHLLVSLEKIELAVREGSLSWTSLHELWSTTKPSNSPWEGRSFEDTTVIGFTSGTTSYPKACPQSSENLMTSAVAVRSLRKLGPSDRLVQHLPGFAAMSVLISLTFGISGGTIVYPSAQFNATATLDAIKTEKCTYMFAAPAIIKALAIHPTMSQRSLQTLRIVELGGAPIYPEILALSTSEQGLNCSRVGCGWGMTESPAPLLAEPWERNMPMPTDSIPVGKPIRGTRVKVCTPGSNAPLKVGNEGELHVGGPQVVRGYLNANDEAFYTENGIRWIKTGDMARIDEHGNVHIIGRYKDIIIRGGQNISPSKIERCLEKVSNVEVQVIGIPDDLAGEVPIAVLKLSNPATDDPQQSVNQVRQLAMGELGPTETPHAYLLLHDLGLDTFPITLSGKIQKAKLAGLVREHLSSQANSSHTHISDMSTTEHHLLELWSKVSGVAAENIDQTASVFTFVDSITTMRFSTLVKKQLQKDLSVDDVISHPSINDQAKLLDTPPTRSTAKPLTQRSGPPTVVDMVHCQGDAWKANLTENLTIPFLADLGLGWNDVEDVFPTPDTSHIYLNRQRPQTWNQRVIYLAPNTDVQTLNKAWQAILFHHPMFRTIALPIPPEFDFEGARHIFIVLRPNENYWNCSTTTNLKVNTPDDLRSTFVGEWADSLSGPLIRIAFVSIQEPSGSAFILLGNHAAFDNFSMDLLFSDLQTALEHNLSAENILQAPGHAHFKHFAEKYYIYRTKSSALEAATFHANRLRGIREHVESLWPKPRAPGCFKGCDTGWTHPDGLPGNPSLRRPLDPPGNRHGLDGLTRTAPVKHLKAMRSQYGILPHVILKVAVALFNMSRTNTCTALFANVEAGRTWPFTKDWLNNGEVLPNPLSIAGPMFQVVVNRISLDASNERVIDMLKKMQEEQALLSKHSQAPLFEIQKQLSEEDVQVMNEAMTRQGYNWAPGIQSGGSERGAQREKPPALVQFNRQAFDDIGLAWTCGLLDPETFYLNASYDDCQLSKAEAHRAIEEVLCAAVWLSNPENVDKGVNECRFEGVEVSGWIKSLE